MDIQPSGTVPPSAMPARLGDERLVAASELLKALAHPARLRIATELRDEERCVHELTDALGLAQPTVSQHLKVLRAARVVRGRRVGREIRYSLTDHHIAHIADDAVTHAGERHDPGPIDHEPTDHDSREGTP